MPDDIAILMPRLALAFGIGLLVGLERGWHARDATPGSRAAGVRTFAISGLLGGLVGVLARAPAGELTLAGALLIGCAFLAFSGVIALFALEENRAAHVSSATTTVAGQLTFVLGAYAALGNVHLAAAAAVATTGILAIREPLHAWVRRITPAEIQSVLVLLAMSFVALPIMPDRPIGPWGGLNPRQIWLIAITLAGISFAGFIAVKALGEKRGVLVASAIGGIISSTAVMFSNARAAAIDNPNAPLFAAGCALATAISFLRVIGIVAVLGPEVVPIIAPVLLAAAAAVVAVGVLVGRTRAIAHAASSEMTLRNPFGFVAVVGMALLMGAMMLLLRVVNAHYGAAGTTTGAALGAIMDVDAMTVSIAQLVPLRLDALTAGHAILAGIASNTLAKFALGAWLGRGRFALAVALQTLACLAGGALVLLLTAGAA